MIKQFKYLDLEFNKITERKYGNLAKDYEFSENEGYKKYDDPVNVDGFIVRNIGDAVEESDAVNKRTVKNIIDEKAGTEIEKLKTNVSNIINHLNNLVIYNEETDQLYISTDIIEPV